MEEEEEEKRRETYSEPCWWHTMGSEEAAGDRQQRFVPGEGEVTSPNHEFFNFKQIF